MVIVNGYIKIVSEVGGGIDQNGNPIEVTKSLSNEIPCNYVRNSYQGKGRYDDGSFTTASYTILIEGQNFSPCRFRLYDVNGTNLGEYEAQQKGIINLVAVGNIQISV